jgi:hypothetical protein
MPFVFPGVVGTPTLLYLPFDTDNGSCCGEDGLPTKAKNFMLRVLMILTCLPIVMSKHSFCCYVAKGNGERTIKKGRWSGLILN